MNKDYYTTTEAARLLAVSADTVLKWVRAGKMMSYRTPGGHCRIPRQAVTSLLPGGVPDRNGNGNGNGHPTEEVFYEYCWDFYSSDGTVRNECRDCIAYKCRAHRCYEMKDLPEHFGPLMLHCNRNCTECEYYRAIQGCTTTAILLSRNKQLMGSLQDEADDSQLTLRFATSEYECASIIETFRPDFVIVDCAVGMARAREICAHLTGDPRIPFSRILITSKTSKVKQYCDGELFGWIRKPFSFNQLRECLKGLGPTGPDSTQTENRGN